MLTILEPEGNSVCPELTEAFLNSQKPGREKRWHKKKIFYLAVNLMIANQK
jgi:hypothetical protein